MDNETEPNINTMESNITIPVQDVYKINILNADGNLERIHIFCGKTLTDKNKQ